MPTKGDGRPELKPFTLMASTHERQPSNTPLAFHRLTHDHNNTVPYSNEIKTNTVVLNHVFDKSIPHPGMGDQNPLSTFPPSSSLTIPSSIRAGHRRCKATTTSTENLLGLLVSSVFPKEVSSQRLKPETVQIPVYSLLPRTNELRRKSPVRRRYNTTAVSRRAFTTESWVSNRCVNSQKNCLRGAGQIQQKQHYSALYRKDCGFRSPFGNTLLYFQHIFVNNNHNAAVTSFPTYTIHQPRIVRRKNDHTRRNGYLKGVEMNYVLKRINRPY